MVGGTASGGGGRRVTRRERTLALGVVLALLVIGFVSERLSPEPEGRASSSYATIPAGAAAYASLLDRNGRDVRRLRADVGDARLDPSETLVLLDPGSLGGDARERIGRFVAAGGRLVVAGAGAAGAASGALDRPPRRDVPALKPGEERRPRKGRPAADAPEAVGTIESLTTARWTATGEAERVLGDLVVAADADRGRVVLLADASPLQNRGLARAANAAVGLALAPRERPVRFVESVHGYGAESGLAALPGRWQALLVLGALAALLLVLAHARRFGPPEEPDADPPPPRRAYVDAVGRTLHRTDDPVATAQPLQHAARELVLRRSALPGDTTDRDVHAAALRLGLDEDEARVVAGGAADREDLLVAGRALAELRRGGA